MTKNTMPERIWAWRHLDADNALHRLGDLPLWGEDEPHQTGCRQKGQYVSATVHASVVAERDKRRAELEGALAKASVMLGVASDLYDNNALDKAYDAARAALSQEKDA